jgi:hypothetical membrane protein
LQIEMPDKKSSFTKSGLLIFLSGFLIFMGIITGEAVYPLEFNTRDHYISELAAALPPNTMVPQPSATIFNLTMILSGLMVIAGTFFIHAGFKKLLSSIPLGLFGVGLLGVGFFPGNIAPWHGISAMVLFLAGGVAAIASFRIVRSPLRYIFICLGIISLTCLITYKVFIPALGVGGAERWVFYPIVFWLNGLGGYLLGIRIQSQS